MFDRLPPPLRRVADAFTSFTPGQKAVTVTAVLALTIGGYFFATWAAKPTYTPLFSNLSGTDASAIVESLQGSSTPYELADGGKTIMVPTDQVYDLRIQLSGEGLPGQSDTGYALLDKQGVTTSDFLQHVGYQRALEGELAKTIQSINGVQAATVHLVMPKKDIFADDQNPPTASVLVASRPGRTLENGQVQSIVHLVASSVEGLNPEQVTVAGSDGRILSAGGGAAVATGDGDARSQQTVQYEQRLSAAIQRMLDSVVGPGHSVVTATADLDFDQTETRTRTYTADPAVPPISESKKTETYTGGGGNNGGVLGPDNIQVPNGAGGNGQYEATEETKNNPVGAIDEVRRSAPGNVRKLNIAVLLDARTGGALDAQQVQELVTAGAGIDAARGDTIAVSAMPFDQTAAEEAQRALAEAGAADLQDRYTTMAKTGGLVLVILILLFLAWRRSRKSRRAALSAEELAQLEAMQAELEELRARELAGGGHAALEAGGADLDDEARQARQREIEQMVDKQPDDVAQLLRGWMSDRR